MELTQNGWLSPKEKPAAIFPVAEQQEPVAKKKTLRKALSLAFTSSTAAKADNADNLISLSPEQTANATSAEASGEPAKNDNRSSWTLRMLRRRNSSADKSTLSDRPTTMLSLATSTTETVSSSGGTSASSDTASSTASLRAKDFSTPASPISMRSSNSGDGVAAVKSTRAKDPITGKPVKPKRKSSANSRHRTPASDPARLANPSAIDFFSIPGMISTANNIEATLVNRIDEYREYKPLNKKQREFAKLITKTDQTIKMSLTSKQLADMDTKHSVRNTMTPRSPVAGPSSVISTDDDEDKLAALEHVPEEGILTRQSICKLPDVREHPDVPRTSSDSILIGDDESSNSKFVTAYVSTAESLSSTTSSPVLCSRSLRTRPNSSSILQSPASVSGAVGLHFVSTSAVKSVEAGPTSAPLLSPTMAMAVQSPTSSRPHQNHECLNEGSNRILAVTTAPTNSEAKTEPRRHRMLRKVWSSSQIRQDRWADEQAYFPSLPTLQPDVWSRSGPPASGCRSPVA
ncbi:hypothetical protein THASP1DRAFT_28687 [Thamnocephalis sphaerospora]|uniref:Uncharacterized protein n=1 Tax=Thamnocephalis sphaerospora TaxID=78915 RepID=A0A4P9XTN1_9FUNG|nr:hypothetical protein THASP1DRAFT_28687 [Thamnocephalis sphaerospora]|eukprot:RKP09527.1 hypothetical protein THASP1DRAFT_28687 [Thamnocephalis sphaerospora]